jgi:mono/diheme cytochrome c family protein
MICSSVTLLSFIVRRFPVKADFDSAIPWFESRRPSHGLSAMPAAIRSPVFAPRACVAAPRYPLPRHGVYDERMRLAPSLLALIIASLAASLLCAAPAARAESALVARGRQIAQHNCARCHAIGMTGESRNPKSPPFRFLSRRYPISSLQEALAEGIMVGHQGLEMPHFQLDPPRIDELLAYIESVQVK